MCVWHVGWFCAVYRPPMGGLLGGGSVASRAWEQSPSCSCRTPFTHIKVYGAAAARRSPESDHFGGRPSRPAYPAASVCIHLHEVGSAADGVGSPRHGDADVAELDVLYAVFRELQYTKRISTRHP